MLESILNIAQRNLNKSGEDDVDVAAAKKTIEMNYVMRFYFDSLKVPISETVRFVVCLFHWMLQNQLCIHAAAK